MKKTLLLAATLMVALPGATQADPPVGPGQPPIRQIFPGPQAVPAPQPAIALAKKIHRAPNGKAFPAHWGAPPLRQTRDLRPFPGGYGRGSGTLARWIAGQLALDKKNPNRAKLKPPIAAPAPPPDPVAPHPNAAKVNPADIAKVKTALAAWAKAKAKCGGNYEYTIGFQSAFGFGHTTTIVVKNNKVFERRFEEFNRREGPPRPGAKPKGFVEKGDALGKNKKGAPVKTLDEIYKTAAAIAAKALPPHEVRYVRTDKNGLLTSCFIRDRRIADDAPRKGVALGRITLASGNAKKVYKAPNGKPFPVHWGAPPLRQTRDLRPFPGGYGRGSSTLRNWIQKNLEKDAKKNNGAIQIQPVPRPVGLPVPPPRPQIATPPPIILGLPAPLPRPPLPTPAGDCTLCRTEAHQLHLGLAENGGTITVKLGSVVRVKLRGNPTTGFTWNNATPTGVLKLMGKVAHQAGGRPGLLGAPGMSTATFATTKLGKGTIVLNYNRVFELNPAPASTVKINIVVTKDGRVQPPAAPSKNTARIAELEKEIAKMKDFARRARFTQEGFKIFKAKLAKLEQELAVLKAGGKVAGVPTFEEWVKGGKKIPAGRVFLGGSPWFNERTGQRRQPQEVYAMLFGKPATDKPAPKPAGRFPAHWGAPPRIQTKDLRVLPGGYGRGSSTLARWIQQNLDQDKANPNRGKAGQDPKGSVLPNKLTLKDAQGGFAGFTGWVTTINEDGTWNRRQFFNQQLRPIEKQGKLTAAQAKAIKAALATAQVEKLPARLGKFQGANPHVVTLTCGEKQTVLTLPTGARMLLQPGGKLTDTGRFTLVAHELMSLKQGAGGTKPTPKIYRAANGKAFPANWGAPPRIQTRDFRPLPGGYGNGSSTLGRWIQQNLDKDKAGANTTKPVAPPNAANGKEIAQLETRVKQIKKFMARAQLKKEANDRFLAEIKRLENRIAELNGKPQVVRPPVQPPTKPNARKKFPAHWGAPPRIQTADYRKLPGGYGSGSSTMAGWIQRNLDADAKDPNRGKPEAGQRPAVSAEFAKKRPAGSYAPGELLVGMQKGTALADSQKALQQALPGFVLVKAMVNGTVLHVRLPATMNVEQGMAKLKTVKSVSYAELNGIVRIQPLPRPGIRPGPRIPPRKLGKPLIRPRR